MIVGALSLLTIGALIVVIWSIRRHRAPDLNVRTSLSIAELIPSLAGLTLSTPIAGNAVRLLENGAAFDVLLEHIPLAERSIHFETFLWKDGALGRRLAAAFSERARAGCQVRLLLDANGARQMGDSTRRQMEEAGCKIALFHDGALHNIGVLNDRDHRKLCVIDGREAFVGGHCVVDAWLGDAEDHLHNADIGVLLHGPIVHAIQGVFSENWAGETGELFVGPDLFPRLAPAGDVLIHAAYVMPNGSAPTVKILHHTAICLAPNSHLDPEPLLHPRTGSHRRAGGGGQARRGCARADAVHQRFGQPHGAACRAQELRGAAAVRRPPLRVPAHAAAPESDDDRRGLECCRFQQFRRPLIRDQ